jgi:hypothetical protein
MAAVLDDPTKDRKLFVYRLLTNLQGAEDPAARAAEGGGGGSGGGGGGGEGGKKRPRNRGKATKQRESQWGLGCRILTVLLGEFPLKFSQIVAHSFLSLESEFFFALCCDTLGSRLVETLFEHEYVQ